MHNVLISNVGYGFLCRSVLIVSADRSQFTSSYHFAIISKHVIVFFFLLNRSPKRCVPPRWLLPQWRYRKKVRKRIVTSHTGAISNREKRCATPSRETAGFSPRNPRGHSPAVYIILDDRACNDT